MEKNELKDVLKSAMEALIEEFEEQGIPDEDMPELVQSIMERMLNNFDDSYDWTVTINKKEEEK